MFTSTIRSYYYVQLPPKQLDLAWPSCWASDGYRYWFSYLVQIPSPFPSQLGILEVHTEPLEQFAKAQLVWSQAVLVLLVRGRLVLDADWKWET
jgi:hypothetical protein